MIIEALVCVFKEWSYLLTAIVVVFLVLVLATWLPNLELVWQIAVSSSVPLLDKVNVLTSLVGSITTNFTVLSGFLTIAIAVLFGMNAAMVTYYVKQRRRLNTKTGQATAAAGLGGLVSGFVGVGCAACGTFALGPVLSLVGAAGLVSILPFEGQEFSMLGVGILGVSVLYAAKKISEPLVCPVVVEGQPQAEEEVGLTNSN